MCDVGDIDFDDDWGDSVDLTESKPQKISETIRKAQENDDKGLEQSHLKILSKCFGHSNFRTLQWKIIRSIIIEKKDVCAIMATGYGKSLCYQFPSVFSGGVTFVISPLISLMEDQVLSLTMSNIPACLLGSAQTSKSRVLSDILSNEYRVIYATPEFCTGDSGLDLLEKANKTLNIDLLAIDEAHCVSQWGHDFRVKYRQISKIRDALPNIPVLAVTATATLEVRNDIIKSLKLRTPNVYCSGFDRPNLYFEVVLRTHSEPIDNLRPFMLRDMNGLRFSGSTIIYCLTKKQTEDVARNLQINQIKCLMYHASMTMTERKKAHEMFVKDQIQVIVATIAFGMGIDKPDVRLVIHYGASRDVEGYYQEVGRAGRDGLPSKCVLLHSSADFHIHDNLREMGIVKSSAKQKEHREQMSKLMQKYIDTMECRRQFILDYFHDDISNNNVPKKSCCDNCKMKESGGSNFYKNYEGLDASGKYDIAKDAMLYLNCVRDLNGKYGASVYILTLRGSRSAKVNNLCQKSASYGKGKDLTDDWLKSVGNLLEREGYLKKVRHTNSQFPYNTIDISDKGERLLSRLQSNENAELKVVPTKEMVQMIKKKVVLPSSTQSRNWSDMPVSTSKTSISSASNFEFKEKPKIETTNYSQSTANKKTEEDPEIKKYRMDLYNKLIEKRSDIAHNKNCMPYMVGSNTALMEMSKIRPKSLEQLKLHQFDGFTEAKIQNFGVFFVDFIREYCMKNPPPSSDVETFSPPAKKKPLYATCNKADLNNFGYESKASMSLNDTSQPVLDTTTKNLDAFSDLLTANMDWDDWNGDMETDTQNRPDTKIKVDADELITKKTKLPETNVKEKKVFHFKKQERVPEVIPKKGDAPQAKPKKKVADFTWD